MKASTVFAGGLAGATAVTLIHESIKAVVPQAPRMDRLGMQAIAKGLRKANKEVPNQKALFTMAMAGDLVSNALYYSAAGIGSEKKQDGDPVGHGAPFAQIAIEECIAHDAQQQR